jgi:hypothetical protein
MLGNPDDIRESVNVGAGVASGSQGSAESGAHGSASTLHTGQAATDAGNYTTESTESKYQGLVTQRLADIDRILERMQRDQEEIQQLKTETRTILARLRAV